MTAPRPDEIARPDEIERLAAAPRRGTLREIFAMLWRRKKWWLTPIVVVLLLIGALLLLAGGPLGPFLYPLF